MRLTRSPVALSLSFVALLALTAPARAATSAQILKLLPPDASMVAVIDVKASHGSALFGQFSAPLWAKAGNPAEVFGRLDPAKDIDQLILAGAGAIGVGHGHGIVIAEGRFPADLLSATKYAAKTAYKGIDVYVIGSHDAAIVDGRLIVTPKGDMTATIDRAQGKGRSAARSSKTAALRAAIAAADTHATAWAAAVVNGVVASTLSGLGLTASWLALSATVGADLAMDWRVGMASPAAAQDLVTRATAGLQQVQPQAGMFGLANALQTVKFSVDGSSMKTVMRLTSGDLTAVMSAVSMFGGLTP